MAKKRLIPKLQLMPSKVDKGVMSLVTTVEFLNVIEIGDPVSQAKIYESQAVDELIFVDLSHSKRLKSNSFAVNLLNAVSKEVFLPLTIGGGVNCVDDFRLFLNNGADKVSINSAALANPQLIRNAAKLFGAQCVVVSIDYKKDEIEQTQVYGNSGSKKYNYHPVEWAKQAEQLGAGEILLTSIDHDGKRDGLELNISRQICESVSIPVILSGGCGLAEHFVDGFIKASADAVSAGTFFCFQDQNPIQTRSFIKNSGIDIRIHT